MPSYDFRCLECNHIEEYFIRNVNNYVLPKCMKCNGDTEKVISLRAADPQKLNGIIFPVDGLTLEHVGPQPIHFDSYRDMKKFAKENNIGLSAVDGH